MENGETVIINARAKPKTGLLVAGVIAMLCCIVSIILTAASKNQTNKTPTIIMQFLLGMSALISLRFYFMSKKSYITVTNMRITGITAWGSTVNLPLNQVDSAAIDTTGALIISVNSGRTIFAKMDNTPQIYDAINRLIMAR